MDLSQKLDEFVNLSNVANKSKKFYKEDINEFIMFLYTYNKKISTPGIFEEYKDYLKNIKKRTDNTIRRKKIVITRFYLFCYPNDDYNHFDNCIVYYDSSKKLTIKDCSNIKVVINKARLS